MSSVPGRRHPRRVAEVVVVSQPRVRPHGHVQGGGKVRPVRDVDDGLVDGVLRAKPRRAFPPGGARLRLPLVEKYSRVLESDVPSVAYVDTFDSSSYLTASDEGFDVPATPASNRSTPSRRRVGLGVRDGPPHHGRRRRRHEQIAERGSVTRRIAHASEHTADMAMVSATTGERRVGHRRPGRGRGRREDADPSRIASAFRPHWRTSSMILCPAGGGGVREAERAASHARFATALSASVLARQCPGRRGHPWPRLVAPRRGGHGRLTVSLLTESGTSSLGMQRMARNTHGRCLDARAAAQHASVFGVGLAHERGELRPRAGVEDQGQDAEGGVSFEGTRGGSEDERASRS